ncbi:glycosyl transferase 2 family protein [Candidatus Endolissoclinum faulkneri L2]|uniref:Glycosyl transferase 2 family protein n=1 Tax=Candidatus Endolissoclinum faulkneri L2 TaxID=1193729 RepID=K7Z5J9_9PROT|nr:glycosyltransferase family 2 protein [Candidatus Endolissoclinum faulkneri]AFX99328.1 glycosyl transferase 2 family protein [Candidatus Endolissoclinum faulkneri L2]
MESNIAHSCTVVIVSYHTGIILVQSVKSALQQDGVCSVILVDNGNSLNTQCSIDALAAQNRTLIVIRGQGNVGFARGCNIGVIHAYTGYVLLLNPDCILHPNVVTRVFSAFDANPAAAMATVLIKNPDGTEQSECHRNLMTPWSCVIDLFNLQWLTFNYINLKHFNVKKNQTLREVSTVQCISGAFMMISTNIYNKLGGMDEDYFLHVEDIDLCMRITKYGRDILYVPDAFVTHVKSTSQVSPFTIEWHKSISAIKYFRKHFQNKYNYFALLLIGVAIFIRLAVRIFPIVLYGINKRLLSSIR